MGMNLRLILVTFLMVSSTFADERPFCALDETGEASVFYCKDPKSGGTHVQEIHPLMAHEAVVGMGEEGISVISMEEFVARVTMTELEQMGKGPNAEVTECFQKIYYRVNQFNRLPTSDATVQRLIQLATALQQAGVCDLPVKNQNFNSINIQSSQDVLHHFLCISNSESVFGRDNIGQGGRGPWGIHPMHNQPSGTRAFVDGRTVTLKRNGQCYPSRAIVRDANGVEIKRSSAYRDEAVILDNAKCAMTLYRQKGFTDWGRTNVWGSNRHCSSTTRNRLEFFKHIGPLGCCTEACRKRFTDL
jgi:hypothetical protein